MVLHLQYVVAGTAFKRIVAIIPEDVIVLIATGNRVGIVGPGDILDVHQNIPSSIASTVRVRHEVDRYAASRGDIVNLIDPVAAIDRVARTGHA